MTIGRFVLSLVALGILLSGCGVTSISAPAESTGDAPASQADEGAIAEDVHRPPKWPKELIGKTQCVDGVKGVIENYTDRDIEVTSVDKTQVLAPQEGAVFYDCTGRLGFGKSDRRLPTVHLGIRAVGSAKEAATVTIVDYNMTPWPTSVFKADGVETRRSWSVDDAHHDASSGTDLWIRREEDGWDGGHESWYTSDWPVFTIHVDRAS